MTRARHAPSQPKQDINDLNHVCGPLTNIYMRGKREAFAGSHSAYRAKPLAHLAAASASRRLTALLGRVQPRQQTCLPIPTPRETTHRNFHEAAIDSPHPCCALPTWRCALTTKHSRHRSCRSSRFLSPEDRAELKRRATALQQAEALGAGARLVAQATWTRANIPPEMLAEEPSLATSCWPAHLFRSPLDRTRQFLSDYLDVYRVIGRSYHDDRNIAHLCPVLPTLELNAKSAITALWRARQMADEIGIPYREYLFLIMRHMESVEGHKRLPLPNQLYHPAQIRFVLDEWPEKLKYKGMPVDEWDARLRADHFHGTAAQVAFHSKLFDHIGNSRGRLADFLIRTPMLPEVVARERLGDEIVDAVLASHAKKPAPTSLKRGDAYHPPCIGLPNQGSGPCSPCPFAAHCQVISSRAVERTVEIYGDADPRARDRRRSAAERQRRSRENKRKLADLDSAVPG